MQLPAHRSGDGVGYVAGTLVAAVFLPGMATGLAYPTLPRLEAILGIPPVLVGIVISAQAFTRLLCNAPAGSLFDRVGTRRPLIVGFLLMGLAPFGYAVAMHPGLSPPAPSAVLLVSRGALGVGAAVTMVGGYATITNVSTSANRGRWLGYMLGSYGTGYPLGLVAGGIAADVYGVQASFLLAGVVGTLSVIPVLVLLPNRSPDVRRDAGLRAVPGLLRTDHRLIAIGSAFAIVRFLSGVFLATVVLVAAQHDITVSGLAEYGVSGVVLGVSTVCSATGMLVAGRISDALANRVSVIVPGLLVVALGFALVASVPTFAGLTVGVAVAGLGGGATAPSLMAYLGDISPSPDVGKLGGVHNVMGDVGTVLGPVVALPVASAVGIHALYLACTVVSVFAAVLVGATLLSAPTTPKPAITD